MVTVVNEVGEQVTVPDTVHDLESFRAWAASDDFPDGVKIWWLEGEVWIELAMEQIFTHNLLKTKLAAGLTTLVEVEDLGLLLGDGALLSNFDADIAGEPDGMFIAKATLESDRVRLIEGQAGGFVEIQGSPDMVLEVLSPSSRHKDQVALKRAYWHAGIPEYWLVNALEQPLRFDLFRRGKSGYVAVRRQEGWIKSGVFDRSIRIVERQLANKYPDYKLEMR